MDVIKLVLASSGTAGLANLNKCNHLHLDTALIIKLWIIWKVEHLQSVHLHMMLQTFYSRCKWAL